MLPGAEPIDLQGDQRGVLVVHGFTGTPFEMRPLAEALGNKGLTVTAPLLPGHGTTPGHLAKTGWRDWLGAVLFELDRLSERCSQVAVVGQSLGGLLALRAASVRKQQLTCVAALATPLWLPPLARAVAFASRRSGLFRRLGPGAQARGRRCGGPRHEA